ncbi:MAG: AI-2E family transporter [Woeseiaceae bacterium]|nr:AI-2E family transporter [Woeseiaceae bacterium]
MKTRSELGGPQLQFSAAPSDRRPVAVVGLLALAVVYTLYFAAGLLIPIAISIFISITCSPVVRHLARWHIPQGLSAAIIVGTIMSVAALTVLALAGPAEKWLNDAPQTIRGLQDALLPAKGPMADFQELADEVNELGTVDAPEKTPSVIIEGPGILENVVGGLPSMLASVGIVIFLSFFLMASGDSILRKLTRCGRNWSERRRIVAIARCVQSDLSRYLAAVTLINLFLGAAVATTMHLLKMPNPLLWGAMVAVLNFAPYIGALVSAAVLTLVALTTFPNLAEALMVPGSFLVLTILEGQVITPTVLGRRMALSPAILFVSVIIWGWLWGIAGALMAVPITTSLKVVFDHSPTLGLPASFLGKDSKDSIVQKTTRGRRTPVRSATQP